MIGKALTENHKTFLKGNSLLPNILQDKNWADSKTMDTTLFLKIVT